MSDELIAPVSDMPGVSTLEQVTNNMSEKLMTEYSNEYGSDKKSISPIIISMLLDLAVSVIKGCIPTTQPAQMIATAKRGGFLARLAMRRAARHTGITLSDRDMDVLMRAGSTMTPEDIVSLSGLPH